MKKNVISDNTKQLLANSLKILVEIKPYSKITISDIVKESGVYRKTFYYHFEDINSLFKWILDHEAISSLRHYDFMNDYEKVISFVIEYVEANAYLFNCIFDALGREKLKEFLSDDFLEIALIFVKQLEEDLEVTIDDQFRVFTAEFYKEAIIGMIINLFQKKYSTSKEETLKNITTILTASLEPVIEQRAEELKKNNSMF